MFRSSGSTVAPRRRRMALLAVGAAIAATVGTAAPAVAAPAAAPPSQCPFSSTLCLFDGTSFTGERFTVSSLSGGVCVSLVDHGWGGRASSVVNTDSNSAALFANDGCVGGPFQVPANSGIADLGSFSARSVWVA